MKEYKRKTSSKAQSIIELAVFGSIFIFILGIIVRQSMGYGYVQHHNLKAMRLAMTLSYKYSEGLMSGLVGGGWPGVSSRNSASVLLIEDRLSASQGRNMAVDRNPQVASGGGTFSRNLLMPFDPGEWWNLPIFDVFINGKHFPLAVNGTYKVDFRKYWDSGGGNYVIRNNANGAPGCDDITTYEWGGSVKTFCFMDFPEIKDPQGPFRPDEPTPVGPAGTQVPNTFNWEADCNLNTFGTGNIEDGCQILYVLTPNHPAVFDWCETAAECNDPGNAINVKFDIDRDGFQDVPSTPGKYNDSIYNRAIRPEKFAWQWTRILPTKKNLAKGKYTALDFDGDLQEETLVKNSDQNFASEGGGKVKVAYALDGEYGDLDFATMSTTIDIGLQRDTEIWTFVDDGPGGLEGTYAQIEEGKLYTAGPGPFQNRQVIRNTIKKDQVDIVVRTIQLTRNSGRFCPTNLSDPNPKPSVDGETNPVEACCNDTPCCFAGSNSALTCMDRYTNLIFVRSRIIDRRGRKWITDVEDNEYINYNVPGIAP